MNTTWSRFNITSIVLGFAFLYLPIVLLIVFSFNESKLVTVWGGFSTKWYVSLFHNQGLMDATWVTARVGVISATVATVLGTLAALTLTRYTRFMLTGRALHAIGVGLVGDEHLGLGVGEAVADSLIAVEHRHREQDGPHLPRPEERRRRLGRRREQHGHAIAALDAMRHQHVGEAVGGVLELAPGQPAHVAVEVLMDHRQLLARVAIADVGGDVVALGHVPAVLGAGLVV